MKWFKRVLLLIPFVIAAVLTTLMIAADRSPGRRSEHIAGYGFLFATPWAWLIDGVYGVFRFHIPHARWLQMVVFDTLLLWIPAALYSACIWSLFFIPESIRKRTRFGES